METNKLKIILNDPKTIYVLLKENTKEYELGMFDKKISTYKKEDKIYVLFFVADISYDLFFDLTREQTLYFLNLYLANDMQNDVSRNKNPFYLQREAFMENVSIYKLLRSIIHLLVTNRNYGNFVTIILPYDPDVFNYSNLDINLFDWL